MCKTLEMAELLTPEQMNHVRYLLQQMFTESGQTWADVVRYGTSQPLDEPLGYPDDYGYEVWDSDADEDEPDEPSKWDLGIPLDADEEW
jgi:hypothetical protein